MMVIDMTAQLGWLISATQVALVVAALAVVLGPWIAHVRSASSRGTNLALVGATGTPVASAETPGDASMPRAA